MGDEYDNYQEDGYDNGQDYYDNNYDNYDSNSNSNQFCKVYDRNDVFTAGVQIALAMGALASLWWKRRQEHPQRTFRTWLLDVSKQGIGACYAHVLNMMIAAIISQNIRGEQVLEDQCAWYGLSYLIDTTLGLFLSICFLKLMDSIAKDLHWTHLEHSGVYAGPNGTLIWASQVMAWLLIQTIVKFIVYLFMWAFSGPLAWIGTLMFAPIQELGIRFELVFVMILFPGVLNVIYFWVADSYLKADKDQSEAFLDEKEPQDPSVTANHGEHDYQEPTTDYQPAPSNYQPAPWSSMPTTGSVPQQLA